MIEARFNISPFQVGPAVGYYTITCFYTRTYCSLLIFTFHLILGVQNMPQLCQHVPRALVTRYTIHAEYSGTLLTIHVVAQGTLSQMTLSKTQHILFAYMNSSTFVIEFTHFPYVIVIAYFRRLASNARFLDYVLQCTSSTESRQRCDNISLL